MLENPIFSNDICHATVADTQQGWNIMPFPCNCMEPATPEQEEMIKINMIDCQSHGVCKYLMELEEEWENIDFEVPYAEFPNAKMKSLLENKQATEISDGLTGRQCMALYEIMGYLEKYPELCIGTTIFVFEGLATPRTDDEAEWNGVTNTYHPNGQFGAIAIVTQYGKLQYLVQASTLPDNMENSTTICEGIYDVIGGNHKGYAAMWLNNSENIPAYNSKYGNDNANGIHCHMAGVLRDEDSDKPYSEGCITIPVKDYVEFGLEVEFLNDKAKELKDEWNYSGKDYRAAAATLTSGTYLNEKFNGYMVIDRQYYDDTNGYLKFNGKKGEE